MTQRPGPSILVVDDTIENLDLLASILGDNGYEVRPVTSGRMALQAAESSPPELVLLDVGMHGMDGYEVCRRFKASEALRDIPIIFLTALGGTSDKIEASAAGAADHITKPFQVDEVLARVRVHLALRQSKLDLERSYERLRGLERLRDDLVQMVVHDMRSPLSALMTMLELIRATTAERIGEQGAEDLQWAIQAAGSLNRMASDLLDVSRLEEGKLPLDRSPVDLTQVGREAVSRVAALDRTRRIDVVTPAPVEAACDRALVLRIFENLVGNAVKHTPSGGRIELVIERRGGRVHVAVRDQGPGVPVEARTRIFEKFGTLETRRDSEFHSVGLGLTFCKLAVEAHGGEIGVEPNEPRGSVFWFHLPA